MSLLIGPQLFPPMFPLILKWFCWRGIFRRNALFLQQKHTMKTCVTNLLSLTLTRTQTGLIITAKQTNQRSEVTAIMVGTADELITHSNTFKHTSNPYFTYV